MTVISSPLQSLLEVFATDLADVRFGDVDAASLEDLAARVSAAAHAVADAEASLDAARAELAARNDALLEHAHRAHAYARVYAFGREPLSTRLAALTLPKLARRARTDDAPGVAPPARAVAEDGQPPRRPRGRPRKTPVDQQVLAGAEASAE
jgi:hypothetical protein